jgi:uncharacterized protein YndB with AHSA1/START domain
MGEYRVEQSVRVTARAETVWRCVTEGPLLSRWLEAEVTLEARMGGAVSVHFARYATRVVGEVRALEPGRRVAFTWGVAEGPDAASVPPGSTEVSISLAPAPDGGTLVTLRHSGFPDEVQRDHHVEGWQAYLGGLAAAAVRVQAGDDPAALATAFLSVWSEPDAALRDEVFGRVFAPDGRYRSPHADGCGRAWFSQHVAHVQAMFPGTRVEPGDGPLLQCRDAFLGPWRAVRADGAPFMAGWNRYQLAPDGRVAAVQAFFG